MEKVTSSDGTQIAFDRQGDGPALIQVNGAFSYRGYPNSVKLSEKLAPDFTVINYDRRGRGDSGDSQKYAVEREIEDIEALINAVGGKAYVYGVSSGSVLALRAAASGLNIEKMVLFQPPVIVDTTGHLPPADFVEQLDALVAADKRSDAAKYFMVNGMGAPSFAITMMKLMPVWKKLKAVANTLPYDLAVMGDTINGKPLAEKPWGAVKAPTQVLAGGKSVARVQTAAKAMAEALPNGEYKVVDKYSFEIPADQAAPLLKQYFLG